MGMNRKFLISNHATLVVFQKIQTESKQNLCGVEATLINFLPNQLPVRNLSLFFRKRRGGGAYNN